MTLALDPQKDILVPVPVLKRFAQANNFGEYEELADSVRTVLTEENKTTEEKLEKDTKFSFLKKDTQEYKTLEKNFGELGNNITRFPDGQQARLISCFLYPFGGKVTEPAKIIWEALLSASDEYSLQNVETEARKYQQKRQQAYTTLATSCKTFQESITTIIDKLTPFTQALPAPNAQPAAAPAAAPTAPAEAAPTTAAPTTAAAPTAAAPAPAAAAAPAEAPTAAAPAAAAATAEAPTAAAEAPTTTAAPTAPAPAPTAAAPAAAPARAPAARPAPAPARAANAQARRPNQAPKKQKGRRRIRESILNQYMLDKKLYENRLIGRTEYLASLAKTKNFLLEVKNDVVVNTPPVDNQRSKVLNRFKVTKKLYEQGLLTRSEYMAALLEVRNVLTLVEQPGAPAPAQTFDASTERNKIKDWVTSVAGTLNPLGTLAVSLQDGLTKIKQTLAESTTKKEPLNEIFLSLILGALAAVAAWFTAKWAAKNFGEYLGDTTKTRSGYSAINVPDLQQKAAAGFLGGANAGLGPNGQLIGDDGKQIADIDASIQIIEEELKKGKDNIDKLTAEASQVLSPNPAISARIGADQTVANDIDQKGTQLLQTFNQANLSTQVGNILQQITAIKNL